MLGAVQGAGVRLQGGVVGTYKGLMRSQHGMLWALHRAFGSL